MSEYLYHLRKRIRWENADEKVAGKIMDQHNEFGPRTEQPHFVVATHCTRLFGHSLE